MENWRVETLSRTSSSSSSSMLMHANEKQLRGLMRLGGASPVQRRGPGSSPESDTHASSHSRRKTKEEPRKSHGEI